MGHSLFWVNSNPIIQFEGDINIETIITINNSFIGHKNFDIMKYQIWDFLKVNKFQAAKNEISILGVLDRSSTTWNKKMKIALLANKKNIIDLCNLYIEELKDTEWLIKIFTNFKEAKIWCEN